jgi:hypothetical protein
MVVGWNWSGGREMSAEWRRSAGDLGLGAGVVVVVVVDVESVWVTGKEFL